MGWDNPRFFLIVKNYVIVEMIVTLIFLGTIKISITIVVKIRFIMIETITVTDKI